MKCSSFLYESLSDPEFAFSGEANHCALNKAFNYDKPIWEFFEQTTQKERLYRFGVAMEGVQKFEPPNLATTGDGALHSQNLLNIIQPPCKNVGFPWSELAENDVVVDVGGGIGSVSIQIAEAYPNLKFVVQDRGPVVADGIKARLEHCFVLLTNFLILLPFSVANSKTRSC